MARGVVGMTAWYWPGSIADADAYASTVTTSTTPRSRTRGRPSPAKVAPGTPAAQALATLADAYGPRLRALAGRLCANRSDADDLVQEVFLQAFRSWPSFRGDADAGTWLHAIAARTCRRRFSRAAARRMPAVSQLMPWTETTVMEAAAIPDGEESESERREAIARVQREIARLPSFLRLPLVLKEVLELSVDQTAAALGLAENTVKTRLHRARLALRKAMTAKAAAIEAPAPIYEKQVCLDLLKAKMEAMDRGGRVAGFTVPRAEVCERCRAVFRELDLVQDACSQLDDGVMPASLRAKIMRAIEQRDRAELAGETRPRRGRKPAQGRSRR
jgi:RNA polymerase sigma-70 factor (ECF subfamily)